jgi:hypothetical protein
MNRFKQLIHFTHFYFKKERQKDIKTERQRDKQTNKQTNKQTKNKQTNKQTNLAHEFHWIMDRFKQLIHFTHRRFKLQSSGTSAETINLQSESGQVRGRKTAACQINKKKLIFFFWKTKTSPVKW